MNLFLIDQGDHLNSYNNHINKLSNLKKMKNSKSAIGKMRGWLGWIFSETVASRMRINTQGLSHHEAKPSK